jgi:tRNA U54 and U55 pseudouridine synthase Pus10
MQQGCQFAEVSAAESSDEVTNAFQTILKEARAWKFERNLPRQRKLSMLAVSKMLNSIMRKTSAPTFPTATQMYVCPDSREALKVRMLKIKLRSLQ